MTTHQLATDAASGPSAFGVLVPALVIAVLLIGAFAWGSRRLVRRRPPRAPKGTAAQRADSWRTPGGEGPGAQDGVPADEEPGRPPRR
ncbi:DUF6479 family protein [Kitasatospora sp. NPDC001539]|uniref:DUF6479 family protein n=1 Tax=Kitasatospora sp. NPDC001539 TaxID=3154384 RepID=UPI0033193DBE